MTDQSRFYRKRASEIGRALLDESDSETALRLMHQALSWIQLAENEEALQADAEALKPRPKTDKSSH